MVSITDSNSSCWSGKSREKGKGRGIYLWILDHSTSFSLSNLSFPEENFAFVGKDVYFGCVDLPSVGNSSSFVFSSSINRKRNKPYGIDLAHFVNDVDLLIFVDRD
jgi:hypothetical protein